MQNAMGTINDLVLINNDRIKGYELALKNIEEKDADLRMVFQQMIDQSRQFNEELTAQVRASGAVPETGTSVSGRLHRKWMDLKITFMGKNRRSLLIECEKGEDASKEAYNEALHEYSGLNETQLNIIAAQAERQKVSHDTIKALRDRS